MLKECNMMIFSTERGARKDADVQRSDFDHPACPCGRLAPFFNLHVEYVPTYLNMYVRLLTQHSLSSRSEAVCSPIKRGENHRTPTLALLVCVAMLSVILDYW